MRRVDSDLEPLSACTIQVLLTESSSRHCGRTMLESISDESTRVVQSERGNRTSLKEVGLVMLAFRPFLLLPLRLV
jgi:hypothetical protein